MAARDDILARIHAALRDAPVTSPIPREYRHHAEHPPGSSRLVDLFGRRLEDYGARVRVTASDHVEDELATILAGARVAVVPPGLRESWRAAVEANVGTLLVDGDPGALTASELDSVDIVVTACAVAIAETGTIVLDGTPGQGRRAITLLPDHHVVVVLATQIVGSLPEAIALLDATRPLTFVSGPSATSDIEFQRVQGVHGPRRLDVVIASA